MIKKLFTVAILAVAGLFAWYFFTDDSQGTTNEEKARSAMGRVGDTFKDLGVEGLVRTRLTSALGFEDARFLHTTNESGHVVVYGMASPGLDLTKLHAELAEVPGVASLEIQVTPLPPGLASRMGVSAPSAP